MGVPIFKRIIPANELLENLTVVRNELNLKGKVEYQVNLQIKMTLENRQNTTRIGDMDIVVPKIQVIDVETSESSSIEDANTSSLESLRIKELLIIMFILAIWFYSVCRFFRVWRDILNFSAISLHRSQSGLGVESLWTWAVATLRSLKQSAIPRMQGKPSVHCSEHQLADQEQRDLAKGERRRQLQTRMNSRNRLRVNIELDDDDEDETGRFKGLARLKSSGHLCQALPLSHLNCSSSAMNHFSCRCIKEIEKKTKKRSMNAGRKPSEQKNAPKPAGNSFHNVVVERPETEPGPTPESGEAERIL